MILERLACLHQAASQRQARLTFLANRHRLLLFNIDLYLENPVTSHALSMKTFIQHTVWTPRDPRA